MKSLTIHPSAKINLTLDVLKKIQTGPFKNYHKVRTILCEINEKNCKNFKPDVLKIKVSKLASGSHSRKSRISLKTAGHKLKADKNNSVFRAAELMLKIYESKRKLARKVAPLRVEISLKKNIPPASGIGGGSSDAAETLKALNTLLNLKQTDKKLQSLAATLGMDTPFFIKGGLAHGTNLGEKITQLSPSTKGLKFKLFWHNESKNLTKSRAIAKDKTAKAFQKIDISKCGKNAAKTTKLLKIIRGRKRLPLNQIEPLIHNDFETLTPDHSTKKSPRNHHLTGSGPTQFALN